MPTTQDIIRETRGEGVYTYLHGPGIDEPLARIDGAGGVAYFHADGLGSIVKMTDATGATVLDRVYDAWGNPELGADEPGYAFTGREWDPETGLYYYRARYYDPKVGRFISEDPIGFEGGVNYYAYVGGRPGDLVDPTGFLQRDEKGRLIWIPRKQLADMHDDDGEKVKMFIGDLIGDDGTRIRAFKNATSKRGYDSNCHGRTFADAKYWIVNADVDALLKADSYTRVSDPQRGDIVVYRSAGQLAHSVTIVNVRDGEDGTFIGPGEAGPAVDASDLPVTPGPGGAWPDANAVVEYYRK